MKKIDPSQRTCCICEKSFPKRGVVSGELVCKDIVNQIKSAFPDWSSEHFICHADLASMGSRHVHSLLMAEKGELTSLEHKVLDSLSEHELLAANLEATFDQKWTLGERLADKIASFGGSWLFLIFFAIFLVAWVLTNSLVYWLRPADPYPFIFLNLILSCLAAIQAPVIMMSQNRLEAKDRIRSQHDYQVNLKAELEIRNLHAKMDHLLSYQWEKMVQIQEIQLEILSELTRRTCEQSVKKSGLKN